MECTVNMDLRIHYGEINRAQPSHPHAGQTAKGVVHVVSSEGVVTSQGCVMGENSLLGSPSTNPRHKPGQVGGLSEVTWIRSLM
jgi:hypothetical protein